MKLEEANISSNLGLENFCLGWHFDVCRLDWEAAVE